MALRNIRSLEKRSLKFMSHLLYVALARETFRSPVPIYPLGFTLIYCKHRFPISNSSVRRIRTSIVGVWKILRISSFPFHDFRDFLFSPQTYFASNNFARRKDTALSPRRVSRERERTANGIYPPRSLPISREINGLRDSRLSVKHPPFPLRY